MYVAIIFSLFHVGVKVLDYMELGAIRSFFPHVPVLALTATAPPKTISLLKEILLMECPKVVKVNPNKEKFSLIKDIAWIHAMVFKVMKES